MWRRIGYVATFGELFFALGKRWPATNIYYFYRTLRVVALKRRKGKSAATASGSVAGLTDSNLQAARIRQLYKTNKDLRVEEYVAARGVERWRT